ncbi:SAM-dependent MidA family methyltransferase [Pseudaminobacter salicylatoxidans]|uniref:SAM-dependent MidA family methyltransferase n=1 Tax=Pseudaminobacter salicylatoxidans TaxID=93369 RepID=A0A316BQA1_PSESE|nr:class I SAM-dependent methyltransferase [Pseudaminobacter salicylatoxidans]PWJ75783.1 SAM-dependent MidA family methyltransferase [Pseudaminobacter salicylatoxidans]
MTGLKQRIADLVLASGPLSVADYMALCLFDPKQGYYTTREPFGTEGDFTTAPEISQMFGELVAIWLRTAWDAAGRTSPFVLAEIGPGRGTLMKDMLRTLSKLDPAFAAQASVAMVETSPRLTDIQKRTLGDAAARASWHHSVDALPHLPLFIVGNELFDAIPIRQFVRAGGAWRERAIDLDDAGNLRFVAGAGSVDPALLPTDAATAPEGAVVEVAPARSALMETIAARISSSGGAGLFIDYGYLEPGVGDTLQALRKHRYEDVLESPGEADLTSHVDFHALAMAARVHGLAPHFATQGDFLLGMGLLERAGSLGAPLDAAGREKIHSEVERLAGPDAMGNLFKVLAVARPEIQLPPFSKAD